jgi:hypothetical protein
MKAVSPSSFALHHNSERFGRSAAQNLIMSFATARILLFSINPQDVAFGQRMPLGMDCFASSGRKNRFPRKTNPNAGSFGLCLKNIT